MADKSAADFERVLSRGLNALAAGQLAEARQAIDSAIRLRPEDPGAKNALAQLVAEERRERIATLQAEAQKLVAAEQWQAQSLNMKRCWASMPVCWLHSRVWLKRRRAPA